MSNIFEFTLALRQKTATSILEAAARRDCLANSYLLTGTNNEDMWLIVRQLASYFNCLSGKPAADGGSLQAACAPGQLCLNCRWISKGEHPQALLVLAGEQSKTGKIAVAAARQLSQELSRTSKYRRLVVVPYAGQDIFHRPAANALLKTIEEPGADCHFFLFARQSEDVLPTVVSRCQSLPICESGKNRLCLDKADESILAAINNWSALSSGSDALDRAAFLLELAQQTVKPESAIDIVVSREIDNWREIAGNDATISLYLSRLFKLAEEAKQQLAHFVQLKSVMESLAFSWHEIVPLRST